jgi:hypothetical protein
MGKKNKSKTEEHANLGEVTKAEEVVNASESEMYDQEKENKNKNFDIDEQAFKMEKTKLPSNNAFNQKESDKSIFSFILKFK